MTTLKTLESGRGLFVSEARRDHARDLFSNQMRALVDTCACACASPQSKCGRSRDGRGPRCTRLWPGTRRRKNGRVECDSAELKKVPRPAGRRPPAVQHGMTLCAEPGCGKTCLTTACCAPGRQTSATNCSCNTECYSGEGAAPVLSCRHPHGLTHAAGGRRAGSWGASAFEWVYLWIAMGVAMWLLFIVSPAAYRQLLASGSARGGLGSRQPNTQLCSPCFAATGDSLARTSSPNR